LTTSSSEGTVSSMANSSQNQAFRRVVVGTIYALFHREAHD
jgi:hypothetical protein